MYIQSFISLVQYPNFVFPMWLTIFMTNMKYDINMGFILSFPAKAKLANAMLANNENIFIFRRPTRF